MTRPAGIFTFRCSKQIMNDMKKSTGQRKYQIQLVFDTVKKRMQEQKHVEQMISN